MNTKKLFCIVLSFALLVASVPVANSIFAASKKASIKTKKITVYVGKKATIKLKNTKKANKYSYKTANKKVATVTKKGVVKGIKVGSTKITVKESYKKNKKTKTRTLGKVTVTVKNEKAVSPTTAPDENVPTVVPSNEPVATASPAAPTPTVTPRPITYTPFKYEALDEEYINKLDKTKKFVAFAFDDGPVRSGQYNTTAKVILDTLEKNNAHATFFYWGNNINSTNTNEILHAKEIGCEIGNHTMSHPHLSSLKTEKIEDEVEKCRAKLEEITGIKSFLMRLPYLDYNDKVRAAVNVPMISCGVDSGDWNNGTKDSVVEKIKTAYTNGSLENAIILMHENYDFTAQAVEELVPFLKENGYEIVSVSELAEVKNVTLTTGKVYTYIK